MERIKLAINIARILTIYFLIYNTIFGWNMEPINEYEKICDTILSIGMKLTAIIYFSPLFKVYENYIRRNEKEEKRM
jgi:hypothetical protein